MRDIDKLRLRLDLSVRIARESLELADIHLANLKQEQGRAQQIRQLKRQLSGGLLEYPRRTLGAVDELPPRRARALPPPSGFVENNREIGASGKAHRSHLRSTPSPSLPSTPTTPSTPELDVAQLELDLPSPISDSDSFWDLNSIASTGWDEDESTAATDTPPPKHPLKHKNICVPTSRISNIRKTKFSGLDPIRKLAVSSPISGSHRLRPLSSMSGVGQQAEHLHFDRRYKRKAYKYDTTLLMPDSVLESTVPTFSSNNHQALLQLVFCRCIYLFCFLFMLLLLYLIAAFTLSDVLSPEEFPPDILDVIRRAHKY